MRASYPCVSVIITTHNRMPEVVLRAVNSVLKQTYCNIEIIVVDDSKPDYPLRHDVESSVKKASGKIIYIKHETSKDTYFCVIVDEYQDCVVEQHRIFLEVNKTVPVYILGDPLQSIFGWAGKPVSWNNIGFERVFVETAPHRWERGNAELGQYLTTVRDILMPSLEGKIVRLSTIPNGSFIKRIFPAVARGAGLYSEMNHYQSALYLTKWPQAQCSFSRQTGGIFQNDEPQNLNDLYNYAQYLDTDNGYTRTETIYSFIEECATQVNAELGSYKKHIKEENFDFGKIKKHPEFGKRILKLYQNHGYEEMLSVLEWVKANSTF